jgi:uncharacterized membrane protein YhaH (DUF805 family)
MTALASLNSQNIMPIVLELCDPRGRCNARGLQRSTLYLLAIQVGYAAAFACLGIDLQGTIATLIGVAFCWLGFTLVAKRLHDIGRTAWWFAAALTMWMVSTIIICASVMMMFGTEALDEGTTARLVMLAVTILPLFASLIWLHFAAGNTGDNRFGPAPDASGFAMPAGSSFSLASGNAELA